MPTRSGARPPPARSPRSPPLARRRKRNSAYHLRHASEWLIRLGDGTAESHARAQAALDALWPYTAELSEPDPAEAPLVVAAILPDPVPLRAAWSATVDRVLARATLARPADGWAQTGGRRGLHTEAFGKMLAEMQSLARAHPGAVW